VYRFYPAMKERHAWLASVANLRSSCRRAVDDHGRRGPLPGGHSVELVLPPEAVGRASRTEYIECAPGLDDGDNEDGDGGARRQRPRR
jgi:hypothetical protein